MGRSVAPCLVLALLALSSSVEARDLMGLNGHRNGVAFADNAYYYVSNGNGTWSMAAPSQTVGLLGSYASASFTSSTTPATHPMVVTYGIASVAFPSKGLGIAVGMPAPGTGSSLTTMAANNPFTTAGADFVKTVPTIMMTLDGGSNWMQTDNIPATDPASTPDLFTVFCPTKLVCWAAGGVFLDPTSSTAIVDHSAAILMTYDGGLSWSYTLCPDIFGPPVTGAPGGTAAWNHPNPDGCPSYSGYYLPQGGPKVGVIFDIASDSSAMHVFAVGAYANNDVETGAILYSGNGGVNWVQQTTPAFMAVSEYSLFGVAVATGKVAFACGGQARASANAVSADAIEQNGVILMTTNGGYSWVPQYVVSNYTGKAPSGVAGALPFSSKMKINNLDYYYSTPLLTDIFFNRNKNVNSTVWAVGLSLYDAGVGVGSFSALKNDYVASASTRDYLPCYSIFAAVLRNGLASTNTTLSFNLILPSSLPPSYAESNACGNDLYGVVFDNTNHGWIYGKGTILVTQNAGLTWQYETPNSLIVLSGTGPANPGEIFTIANVPSNY